MALLLSDWSTLEGALTILFSLSKVLTQLTPPLVSEMDTLLGNKPRSTKKERSS